MQVAINDRGEPEVKLQMNQLSLRNNRLKFETSGQSPIISEEFIEYIRIWKRKTGGCQHVTGCTCKH